MRVWARQCGSKFERAGVRVGAGSGTRVWVWTWACGRAMLAVDLILYCVVDIK